MKQRILILDFGSQYTQLIARRIRELNVYSEIVPYNKIPVIDASVRGVILSGSPFSCTEENALKPNLSAIIGNVPLLGICYGAQYLAHSFGGTVAKSAKREYGKASLNLGETTDRFLKNVTNHTQIWMSHGDSILGLSEHFEVLAATDSIPVAAFRSKKSHFEAPVYGIQFHPEVTHSLEGITFISYFVLDICGCAGDWTPSAFAQSSIENLQNQLGSDKVLLGLSGGVDSSVAAMLLHQAIGKNLFCFFIDNGLLRKGEYEEVLQSYQGLGLNVVGIDAKDRFYDELAGKSDPEQKRKTIGRVFIEVFEEEAKKLVVSQAL